MLARSLVNALLLFSALVLDLGLPVWSQAPLLPDCLDLAFLFICLTAAPRSAAVLWAGLVGAGQEFVHLAPIGSGIMAAATVALILSPRTAPTDHPPGVMDRLFSALMLLAALVFLRSLLAAVPDPNSFAHDLSRQASQLALTYLIAALCLGTMAISNARILAGRRFESRM
jgi:hypothetical protein